MRLTAIFLLVFALNVGAQTRTFRWDDALCTYTGTYDLKTFTPRQLGDTLKLGDSAGTIPLFTQTTAFKITDIAGLDVAALDRDYTQKLAELRALDIVRVPYWETMRQQKIQELEDFYRLTRVSMRAYRDPRALLEYRDAPACSTKYAEPLIAGGDALLTAWRTTSEESQKKNGDPERIRHEYERQLASPDRIQYALVEVLTFGWTNCANALINYVEGNERQEKEFKKLFKRVRTISCDEP